MLPIQEVVSNNSIIFDVSQCANMCKNEKARQINKPGELFWATKTKLELPGNQVVVCAKRP
jgi:hypothetical protein